MKIVRFDDRSFVPAGHEDPRAPGVLKKVLIEKADLKVGRVQMMNWARLLAGQRFARHYHEDMQEVFILVQGEAQITAGTETAVLQQGDTVIIDPRETHEMWNPGPQDVDYLAIGITSEQGGRTVVVNDE